MLIKKYITLIVVVLYCNYTYAQNKPEFNEQAFAFGNYAPDNTYDGLLGGRYIPEIQYNIGFELVANIYGTAAFDLFDDAQTDRAIDPYRILTRYTGKQFEVRLVCKK